MDTSDEIPAIIVPYTDEELAERKQWEDEYIERETNLIKLKRLSEYQLKADPLFFGWQRNENTEQEWLDMVKKVKDDNPYPV